VHFLNALICSPLDGLANREREKRHGFGTYSTTTSVLTSVCGEFLSVHAHAARMPEGAHDVALDAPPLPCFTAVD
jgi:hypothetical protein